MPPVADVPTYKGNAARTGVEPGPGPVARPIVAWSRQLDGPISSTPAVSGGLLIVGSDDKHLYAFDARTGAERWRFNGTGAFQGAVATGTGLAFASDGAAFYAVDLASGTAKWHTADTVVNQPVVVDAVVYVGTSHGRAIGFDVDSGAVVWSWQAPTGVGRLGITVFDGVAYLSADDGRLYAVDIATAKERWHHQTISRSTSSPAIEGDSVYVSSLVNGTDRNGELYALDRETGSVRWSKRTDSGNQLGAPSVRNGIVFAPTPDSGLYAFDAQTGAELWRAAALPATVVPIAIVDTLVYAQGIQGGLLALDAATGAVAWTLTAAVGGGGAPIVTGGFVFQADSAGIVRAYAEPALVALLPTPSGVVPASPSAAPALADPFEVLGTLQPATTKLGKVWRFTVGSDNRIYAVDDRPRISVVDSTGRPIAAWGSLGSGPGQFDMTYDDDFRGGIARSSDGLVYVADGNNHRVQVFKADGSFLRQIGSFGTAEGQFLQPDRLVADPAGNIYVEDQGLGAVTKLDAGGAFVWRVGGSDSADPDLQRLGTSVAIGSDGLIYVANDQQNRIVVLDRDGKKVASFADAGPGPGQLRTPCAIAVDAAGNIYVWSCADSHTQVFDPTFHLIADAPPLPVPAGIRDMAFGPDGVMSVISQAASPISRIEVTLPKG